MGEWRVGSVVSELVRGGMDAWVSGWAGGWDELVSRWMDVWVASIQPPTHQPTHQPIHSPSPPQTQPSTVIHSTTDSSTYPPTHITIHLTTHPSMHPRAYCYIVIVAVHYIIWSHHVFVSLHCSIISINSIIYIILIRTLSYHCIAGEWGQGWVHHRKHRSSHAPTYISYRHIIWLSYHHIFELL